MGERNFKFQYDNEGYYIGLARPIETSFGLKQFPENCTDMEPYWQEGYVPRFDHKVNNWTLEKRGARAERYAWQKYADYYQQRVNSFNLEVRTLDLQMQEFRQSILGQILGNTVAVSRVTERQILVEKQLRGVYDKSEVLINEIRQLRQDLKPWYKKFWEWLNTVRT